MQKQEFRTRAASALRSGDILEFQKTIKSRLQDNLSIAINNLSPLNTKKLQESEETDARITIESAARSFGGNNMIYSQGVSIIEFESKTSALHFNDWLESCEFIDAFEFNVLFEDDEKNSNTRVKIALEDIIDDSLYTFEFIVYLDPNIVEFEDEDGEEYDNEETNDYEIEESLNEVERKIKMSSLGKKIIKMKCNPGFKWDSGSRSCQKISGTELAVRRKAIKKRLITMKSEGPSLKKRSLIKMRKALRFRKSQGLD
jgi:hypothetical protein